MKKDDVCDLLARAPAGYITKAEVQDSLGPFGATIDVTIRLYFAVADAEGNTDRRFIPTAAAINAAAREIMPIAIVPVRKDAMK